VTILGSSTRCRVAALLLATTASAAHAQQDITGLWGAESVFGPQVRGPITVVRGQAGVTARVGGFEVPVAMTRDSVGFSLPGGQGALRAHPAEDGHTISGFWVQPPGLVMSAAYATPVTLTLVAPGVWRGDLDPLDEAWSLYLDIVRQPDGVLRGVFRNPEANWRGPASAYRVESTGNMLKFFDADSGRLAETAGYDPAERRIMTVFGVPMVLTSRARDQAVGFYARSPAESTYVYRAPVALGDGWSTARASTVGLDESRLAALVERMAGVDPAGNRSLLVHSVLVARHGRLVFEEYFHGFDASRRHDLRSAAKTFTSVLVGAAILHGAPLRDTSRVYALLAPQAATDSVRQRITLARLLTHSSGLACDDNNDDSPGNEDRLQSQHQQPDWYQYMLDLPMAHDPGSTYAYCSGGINLATGMLAAATKQWVPTLFERWLARPMGITHYAITLTPTGQAYGGGGWQLRPRDLLKFGQLYLDRGMWQGTRLVDAGWLTRSTGNQIDAGDGNSDGYAWHRRVLHVEGHDYEEYNASGNGGQLLIVVPALDIAVVFTAGNYQQYSVWRAFLDELVPRYVLAGAR
jgi:CubicO group peptidase (beta-lactamase class C family)